MHGLGRHLLLELKDCNWEVLNDLDYLRTSLRDTAEQIGATVVGESFYQFSPHGISGVLLISESHLCIHTWPEHGYAAVDIFTCGGSVQPERAIQPLVEKLGSKNPSFAELARGLPESNQVACELK